MPLIYYWVGENYRRDLDWGAVYHLNQSNRLLHEIDCGDSLWAFTRTPAGRYVLAAELVVRARPQTRPGVVTGRIGSGAISGSRATSVRKASRTFPI